MPYVLNLWAILLTFDVSFFLLFIYISLITFLVCYRFFIYNFLNTALIWFETRVCSLRFRANVKAPLVCHSFL